MLQNSNEYQMNKKKSEYALRQSAVSNVSISLDLVEEAILKLKVGKAAGHEA